MKSTNIYADMINDNRYIASRQITKDDMSRTEWDQYTQLCDTLAIAAWRDLCGKKSTNIGLAVTGLFAFYGIDAKATTSMQRRLQLCCVTVKREMSVPMKRAKSALTDAKKTLHTLEEKRDEDPTNEEFQKSVDVAQAIVNECNEKIEQLTNEPHNIWYQHSPMLDSTRTHASSKCRKLIEDTIADIIAERALMSYEDILAEAEALKAERKARKKAKAQAQAEPIAVLEGKVEE